MGRGYSGNHPRFSHRQDERYDAKEAYNKDLTASARLHYLENDRHDHESPAHSHCSPMHMHNDRHIRRQAERIARKNEGDVQDIYYELKSRAAQDERSGKKRGNDERSGEERRKDIDEMIYERPDSPMNNNHFRPGDYSPETRQRLIDQGLILKSGDLEFPSRPDFPSGGGVKPKPNFDKVDPKPPKPEPPFSGRGGGVIRRKPDKAIDDRYGSPMNQTGPDYKDRPYARANDALKAAQLDAHLIGEMKKKQDRLSQNTRFGLSGIADRTRDLARMAMDKQDLIGNVQGHMDRDIQTYPQGLGTYFDERSGGIKEAFINDPETFVKSEKEDPKRVLRFKNTPLNACAKSEGGSGCVKQMGGAWRVISNKTDKPWPAKYASKSKAEAALRGYHAG